LAQTSHSSRFLLYPLYCSQRVLDEPFAKAVRPMRNFTRPRTNASLLRGSVRANARTSSIVAISPLAGLGCERRGRVVRDAAADGE
jgi:hypothetical protein